MRERLERWAKYESPRSIDELLGVCRVNCDLLAKYSEHAHKESRLTIWDVAAKLRLLCVEKKRNKPLLIELCRQLDVSTKLSLTETITPNLHLLIPGTLEKLLHELRLRLPVFGSGLHDLSISQIIECYTEQAGGAHVDWITSRLVNGIHQSPILDTYLLDTSLATLQVSRRLFAAATADAVKTANHRWVQKAAIKILSKQPDNVYTRRDLAVVHYEMGNVSEAKKQLEKCRVAEPDWPDALQGLGELARKQGRIEEAKSILKNVAHFEEATPVILLEVAGSLATLGCFQEGAEALERAAAIRELCGIDMKLTGIEIAAEFGLASKVIQDRVRSAFERLGR